jgi:hypothetical protein
LSTPPTVLHLGSTLTSCSGAAFVALGREAAGAIIQKSKYYYLVQERKNLGAERFPVVIPLREIVLAPFLTFTELVLLRVEMVIHCYLLKQPLHPLPCFFL